MHRNQSHPPCPDDTQNQSNILIPSEKRTCSQISAFGFSKKKSLLLRKMNFAENCDLSQETEIPGRKFANCKSRSPAGNEVHSIEMHLCIHRNVAVKSQQISTPHSRILPQLRGNLSIYEIPDVCEFTGSHYLKK